MNCEKHADLAVLGDDLLPKGEVMLGEDGFDGVKSVQADVLRGEVSLHGLVCADVVKFGEPSPGAATAVGHVQAWLKVHAELQVRPVFLYAKELAGFGLNKCAMFSLFSCRQPNGCLQDCSLPEYAEAIQAGVLTRTATPRPYKKARSLEVRA